MATYTFKDLTNNSRVEILSVEKNGNGISLSYTIDGKYCQADGEFYIDNRSVLHHTAFDPSDPENDDKDIELLVRVDF